ncbi:MAG: phosphoglucomutase/phosphomannomutase family protein [Thermosynechococcus sp.]|uniref:phosphoglucomutase/phosphomannomutase family protein n=1 Tax=Thermosynechococcus sp. TaxID=2814275 RepID=UPI00391899AD
MADSVLRLDQVLIPEDAPIRFGTDGWRGIIGAEFTFNRLLRAAKAAAAVLYQTYGKDREPRIIVGYDRRFLAEEFATAVAQLLTGQGYQVWLSSCAAPTPAFSWAVKAEAAIGGLVITASHNPSIYAGLKVKGAFGGSVPTAITQAIEAQLTQGDPPAVGQAKPAYATFDPWPSYCAALRTYVDAAPIREAIATGKLHVCADVMHGVAAGGLERLLEIPIVEFRRDRDPLFGGGAPEPIGRYLTATQEQLRQQHSATPTVCLVFDGDADRLAVIDGEGVLYTAQEIIPILIDHLAQHSPYRGAVIKSLSSSDLVARVATHHGLAVIETPIGFKYIGDRMLAGETILLGGEESGGIGYGHHIPERDAFLSALYLLQALVTSGLSVGEYYQHLQKMTNFYSTYDRVDLTLASSGQRQKLETTLAAHPFTQILDFPVSNWQTVDGYKFHLADDRWLLIRFSGTEPLLRLYCQGKTPEEVQRILEWASQWAVTVAS